MRIFRGFLTTVFLGFVSVATAGTAIFRMDTTRGDLVEAGKYLGEFGGEVLIFEVGRIEDIVLVESDNPGVWTATLPEVRAYFERPPALSVDRVPVAEGVGEALTALLATPGEASLGGTMALALGKDGTTVNFNGGFLVEMFYGSTLQEVTWSIVGQMGLNRTLTSVTDLRFEDIATQRNSYNMRGLDFFVGGRSDSKSPVVVIPEPAHAAGLLGMAAVYLVGQRRFWRSDSRLLRDRAL